jgi:ABC-type branched-subunit amino acid transport system substrate-binding protein
VFPHATWRTYTTHDGLPHDRIHSVCVAGDEVWVATERGLARLEGDEWRSWTVREGLPVPIVTAVDLDPRTGDLWLGTWGGGMLRLSGDRLDRFDQLNSPLAGNLVFALTVAGDRVWAATNGGLSALDPISATWELHFPRRADAPETAVVDLAHDAGHLLVASWCDGLHRFHLASGTWTALAADEVAPAPLLRGRDTTVGVAAGGASLWWAMRDGFLLRRDGAGRWGAARLPGAGAIQCLAARADGAVAVGTVQGLTILLEGWPDTWTHPRSDRSSSSEPTRVRRAREVIEVRAPVLPDDDVRCVAFQDDAVWVGTVRGLVRGTVGRPGRDVDRAPPSRAATDRDPTTTGGGEDAPVHIGILRPGNRTISVPGADGPGVPRLGSMNLMAVNLALEQANDAGGFRGRRRFGFATGPKGTFSGWGWTTPEDDFPALVERTDVVGIVGFLGSDSRVTTAVALRTEMPLVNCAPTPATTDETANPWIFRCRADELRHRRVLDAVFEQLDSRRTAVLRTPDPMASRRLDDWADHARARGHHVVIDRTFDPAVDDLEPVLRAIDRSDADVVLTWDDASTSAAIVRALRDAGMDQVFVGSGRIIDDAFTTSAGPDPGRVFAGDRGPSDRAFEQFSRDYRARFKFWPDRDAYELFQAVDHLLEAIGRAGPDREAVRRELTSMRRDPSADAHLGGADAVVVVGRLCDGAWQLEHVPDARPDTR